MNRFAAHYRRILKASTCAAPLAFSLFLVSCTSTSTSLDGASIGLETNIAAPALTNPEQLPTQTAETPSFAPASQAPQAGNPVIAAAPATGAPEATQLDQNAKLVAAAVVASSNNASNQTLAGGQTLPILTTPAQENTVLDAAAGTATPSEPTNDTIPVPTLRGANKLQAQTATDGATSTLMAAVASEPAPSQQGEVAIATQAPVEAAAIASEPIAPPKPGKKKSLFDSLFSSNKVPETAVTAQTKEEPVTQLALVSPPAPKPVEATAGPVVQQASLDLSKLEQPKISVQEDAPVVDNSELPGVRKGALFEIKRRDSLQDDTDVDIGETDDGPVLLASAAGLARLAPNGLKIQRETVDVACLKPQLVKILKKIERHYSSPVLVTSGYRSPGYNRRVRGAKNSLHMYCAAADVQVVGVGKWELARYARSMPERGGVGTYCHTDSVHIDVGPDRDWNWRCSRRKN